MAITLHNYGQLHDRATVPAYVWPSIFVVLIVAFGITSGTSILPVTGPLTVGILTNVGFIWVLWRRRNGAVPWFEIGAVYLAVVTLYMAYPLIGFIALGQRYTALNDTRLYLLQPQPDEIGRIAWLYVCHAAGFAGVYLIVRARLPTTRERFKRPTAAFMVAVMTTYLAIAAFTHFVGVYYNTASDTYLGTYLTARRLPLVLAQLFNHLNGIKYVLSLMVLATLFSRYSASKMVIVVLLAVIGMITILRLGSRTELVLLVLAVAMMFDMLVRQIRPRTLVVTAITGLVGFVIFGAIRNGILLHSESSTLNPFAYANEFESLFSNAVHLQHVRSTVGELPPAFYLADFAALVPQQVAPFAKIDRADWYVNTFFPDYARLGGGLAFGTISESVLTGGWLSALLAGAALGFCFANVHRLYVRHTSSLWVFVFYVWVTTLSYQSFRNSTFALLVLFAFRFVPAVLLVALLTTLLRPTLLRSRRGPADIVA